MCLDTTPYAPQKLSFYMHQILWGGEVSGMCLEVTGSNLGSEPHISHFGIRRNSHESRIVAFQTPCCSLLLRLYLLLRIGVTLILFHSSAPAWYAARRALQEANRI